MNTSVITLPGQHYIYVTSDETIENDGEFLGTKSWLYDKKNQELRAPNSVTAAFANAYCDKIIMSDNPLLKLPMPEDIGNLKVGDKVYFDINGKTYEDTIAQMYFLDDDDSEYPASILGYNRPTLKPYAEYDGLCVQGEKYELSFNRLRKIA